MRGVLARSVTKPPGTSITPAVIPLFGWLLFRERIRASGADGVPKVMHWHVLRGTQPLELDVIPAVVLENGGVPLTLLERLVDEWIAKTKT